ncbi:hypothetical protein GCM10007368_34190 [Isoptericola cucumis]|uniref:VOC domain-containing protein n=2 Tax=Isoptericola cucumis TaxID=1776856 RepID=A0ABQ2BBY8_9MICO|nr:hypothetical protein GCM10007368_34190 [Isoptericola cucumis]
MASASHARRGDRGAARPAAAPVVVLVVLVVSVGFVVMLVATTREGDRADPGSTPFDPDATPPQPVSRSTAPYRDRMFTGTQVNLYADDVEAVVGFYRALGFAESYRYAPHGDPWHVELRLPGLTLGVASPIAARTEHGIGVSAEGAAMELVLWCDDVDAEFARAVDTGAEVMRAPHEFQDGRLRVAWVRDPAGNPIELVTVLRPGTS